MSEWQPEEKERLIIALESLAKNKDSGPDQTSALHSFYAVEVEMILDTMSNDFELRRALRNLVKRAKEAAG